MSSQNKNVTQRTVKRTFILTFSARWVGCTEKDFQRAPIHRKMAIFFNEIPAWPVAANHTNILDEKQRFTSRVWRQKQKNANFMQYLLFTLPHHTIRADMLHAQKTLFSLRWLSIACAPRKNDSQNWKHRLPFSRNTQHWTCNTFWNRLDMYTCIGLYTAVFQYGEFRPDHKIHSASIYVCV